MVSLLVGADAADPPSEMWGDSLQASAFPPRAPSAEQDSLHSFLLRCLQIPGRVPPRKVSLVQGPAMGVSGGKPVSLAGKERTRPVLVANKLHPLLLSHSASPAAAFFEAVYFPETQPLKL